MPLSRRDFLRASGLLGAALSATSCSAVGREIAQRDLPQSLRFPSDSDAPGDPLRRLLNRAGYGPRPGDLDRARAMGFIPYLETQLAPDSIADTAADLAVRNLTAYTMDIGQLFAQEPRDAAIELSTSTISRALLSNHQLSESVVEFWSDHFNIYGRKNKLMVFLKIVDDRDVIRPHALGRFPDLLSASAHSPAMLVYLDNAQNLKGAPNENYARELMELHTLGVNAGYTQNDVQELARALTGWGVHQRGRLQGQFHFFPEHHDDGEKTILGHSFPEGRGQADVDQMLAILSAHPATAAFIAQKLVRRFVADDPPGDLIDAAATEYSRTDGDIKSMLRVVFNSQHFAEAPPKLKRPFTFMLSSLRVLGADVGPRGIRSLIRWLEVMGHPLFQWPPPDGYPDVAAAWAANLLPRWNFALALLNRQIEGVRVPVDRLIEAAGAQDTSSALQAFAGITLGYPLEDRTQELLTQYVGEGALTSGATRQRLNDAIALILASPAFQWT